MQVIDLDRLSALGHPGGLIKSCMLGYLDVVSLDASWWMLMDILCVAIYHVMKICTGFVAMLEVMECCRMLVAGSFDVQFFECMYCSIFISVFSYQFVQLSFLFLLKSNTVLKVAGRWSCLEVGRWSWCHHAISIHPCVGILAEYTVYGEKR